MQMPHMDPIFIADVDTLPNRIILTAHERGLTEAEAERLVALLPGPIRVTPCFRCRLTGLWRYEFGLPIERLPRDRVVIGTHMFPPVARLLETLVVASSRLPDEQLRRYLERLPDPARHLDVIAEMAPLRCVDPAVPAEFEVVGHGSGNRTIDWLLHPGTPPHVLLDVKYRTVDLIDGLQGIAQGQVGADGAVPAPQHDLALLFRSTEEKFVTAAPGNCLQGAWVITELRQEEGELHQAFNNLDASRVHFGVIANWSDDVYLLANPAIDRQAILDLFRVNHSERLVFSRGIRKG